MLIAVGMLDTVDHNDGDDNFHYCKIANQCKMQLDTCRPSVT